MTKFSGPRDIGFKRVTVQLRRWVQEARTDILLYSQKRLEDSISFQERLSSKVQFQSIAHHVAEKALGVFVWVRLVVDELSKGLQDDAPIDKLEEAVDQMPKELKDLYPRTMARIDPLYLQEGFAMLQVILCCQLSLSITQLMRVIDTSFHAGLIGEYEVELPAGSRDLRPHSKGINAHKDDLHKIETKQSFIAMSRSLTSRSGGLLEVAPRNTSDLDRTLRFLHQTPKEFARTYSTPGVMGPLGYEPLLHRCCTDLEVIMDDVRMDVLYYAKGFELLAKRSSRPYFIHLCGKKYQDPRIQTPEPSLVEGYIWLLLERPETKSLISEYNRAEEPRFSDEALDCLVAGGREISTTLEDDFLIYLAVGGELLLFIEAHVKSSSKTVPVLQLATLAPNFVPQLSTTVERMKNLMKLFQPRELHSRIINSGSETSFLSKFSSRTSREGCVSTFMGAKCFPGTRKIDSAETILSVLLSSTGCGPADWERELMAEHILLHYKVAIGYIQDDSAWQLRELFVEHCMLKESPKMEMVWIPTIYRNNPGIFEALKVHNIDIADMIRSDYKTGAVDFHYSYGLALKSLIKAATSIYMIPSVANYGLPPLTRVEAERDPAAWMDDIKRQARKQVWVSDSDNPRR